MADNVQFQTAALATPASSTTVATDDVGGVQYQRVKLDIGADGATSPITLLNPLPIGTLPGGTVVVSGTVQALGSIQGVGTFQVLGSVQPVGTAQVLGTIQSHGTNQALGTFQPLAIPGTVQALGTVQTHGTSQVLGSVQGVGTFQVLGSVQTVGTAQVLGSVQAVGTTQAKEVRSGVNFGTRIAGTIGNLIILAANANRLGAMFYLESGSALFLKLGSLAGTFDYTLQLGTTGYYEVPYNYTGTVSGIWQFANGTVQITEVS